MITLDALLTDPAPVSRRIAADALDDLGAELEAACSRLAGTVLPDQAGNWSCRWRISRRLWLTESRWFNASSLTSELVIYTRGRGTSPQAHYRVGGAGGGYGEPPPPALARAIVALIRRRLAELTVPAPGG